MPTILADSSHSLLASASSVNWEFLRKLYTGRQSANEVWTTLYVYKFYRSWFHPPCVRVLWNFILCLRSKVLCWESLIFWHSSIFVQTHYVKKNALRKPKAGNYSRNVHIALKRSEDFFRACLKWIHTVITIFEPLCLHFQIGHFSLHVSTEYEEIKNATFRLTAILH